MLFPDVNQRAAAVAVCYPSSSIDPNPKDRQACYFDYKVTLNAAFAQSTTTAQVELNDYRAVLGESQLGGGRVRSQRGVGEFAGVKGGLASGGGRRGSSGGGGGELGRG